MVRMGYHVRSLHEHEMSLTKLAKMINGIVRCAEIIRDFCLYLATSSAQVCHYYDHTPAIHLTHVRKHAHTY